MNQEELEKRYILGRPVGSGGFGSVNIAIDKQNRSEVAIKVSSNEQQDAQLENEIKIYRILQDQIGFARLMNVGVFHEQKAFVMDLLGKNISTLFKSWERPFSLKTVLMIADQALLRLEEFHRTGYVHVDIKPSNFAVGLGPKSNQIFLIDFGLAKRYRDVDTNKIITNTEISGFAGTTRFAPINAHHGRQLYPSDDLESLAYTLIYLLTGNLPWMTIESTCKSRKMETIFIMKTQTQSIDLCENIPHEFQEFLDSVKALTTEKPNYARYREMFRNLFISEGFLYDYRYDWVGMRQQLSYQKFQFTPTNEIPKVVPSKKAVFTNKPRRFVSTTPNHLSMINAGIPQVRSISNVKRFGDFNSTFETISSGVFSSKLNPRR